ncbi:amidohydrolase [Domibacillus indicus]|uniref:amidohydrolase n=1 Tax=Domibacillus indicus TaxID=1437523 RepID=UPI00203A4859|nr:amidohydrolase [Domibacillus indicus]MCM3791055.1 amidohydrolase [Domibacillus indicus]
MKIINNIRLYRPFKDDGINDLFHVKIEDGKITAIHKGLSEEQGAHVIDGKQKVMSAAFNDSHMHLLRYGIMKKEIDFRDIISWEEMKKTVHHAFHQHDLEDHDWIVGNGIDDSQFEDIDHLLTAEDLEEFDYDKPMFFLHNDDHECLVNRKAMEIIREENIFEEKHEGCIQKDENGNWTGRFNDTALHLIKFHFRQKGKQDMYEAVKDSIPHLLKVGITSVHTDDLNISTSFPDLWNAYTELERKGELKITVHLHVFIYNLEDLKNFLSSFSKRTGDGTERVKVGAIKLFLDGTQRLHTAALRQPYHDKPETSGVLNYSQKELDELVQLAHQNRMQVAMHAIGDRTVEQSLNSLEKVRVEDLRHRIIHAQVLAPDLLERLQKIKPYLEIQPGFLMSEYNKTAKWVGKEQEKYCNAWKTVDSLQIPYTGSSDAPISSMDPHINIFAGVNRTDQQGNPKGGWMPEEKLSIDACYKSYTETPAYLEFKEKEKGKLEEGYEADFLFLSHHPKEVAPMELKNIQVLETWIKGNKVWEASESLKIKA